MNTPGDIERAMKLRRIMSDYLRNRTPRERDRTMQVHLAQARGEVMNAYLLRKAMDRRLRFGARSSSETHDA